MLATRLDKLVASLDPYNSTNEEQTVQDATQLDVRHPSLPAGSASGAVSQSRHSSPSPLTVLEESARRAARLLDRQGQVKVPAALCQQLAGSLSVGSSSSSSTSCPSATPLPPLITALLDDGPTLPTNEEQTALQRRLARRTAADKCASFTASQIRDGLEDPAIALLLASADNRRSVLHGRLTGSLIAMSWSEDCLAGSSSSCLSRAESLAATAFLDAWFGQHNLSPDRRWLTAALTAATPTSLSVTQEVRSVRRVRRPPGQRRPFTVAGPPPPDRGGRVHVPPAADAEPVGDDDDDDEHAPPSLATSAQNSSPTTGGGKRGRSGQNSRKRKGGGGRK